MNDRQYFESLLRDVPANWRGAAIDIFDTAELCIEWFRMKGMEPSSDAVVLMTGMILKRERKNQRGKD